MFHRYMFYTPCHISNEVINNLEKYFKILYFIQDVKWSDLSFYNIYNSNTFEEKKNILHFIQSILHIIEKLNKVI